MNLDFSGNTPIYLQIADMIRDAILSGGLQEGEPIPSVRKMAVDYSINHQTILKATQILINENLIEKKRGQGMFVKSRAVKKLQKSETRVFLDKEIPAFIRRAKSLNMSQSEIIEKIKTEFGE
ncbi:MAG: GntR family transcriptional regulator [Fidelibacterota bacterium]